jgi:hypothetical protein
MTTNPDTLHALIAEKGEEWRSIPGWGYYFVSSFGRRN